MKLILNELAYIRDDFHDREAVAQVLKEDLAQTAHTLVYDERVSSGWC